MNKTKLGALCGALVAVLGLSGCVADGTYYGGGPGYYGGGYGPGYYGAPAPVLVEGGPLYRETVVVDNTRYRRRDGYYNGRGPYYSGRRRGPVVVERRGANRRVPPPVYHRGDKKKRPSR